MTFDNLDMFHALVLFLLDIVYNDEKPEFIFLKENFNIHYTQFNDNHFLQITTIILVWNNLLYDQMIRRILII